MSYTVGTVKKTFVLILISILSFNVVYAEKTNLDVPTPCANIIHNLRIGSNDSQTNGDVSNLQSFLQDEGYLSFDSTGYFGQATFRAVKKFQGAYGISPVGSVGSLTRRKIKALSCDVVLNQTPTEDTHATGTFGGLTLLQPNMTIQLQSPITVTFPTATTTVKMGQTYSVTWNTNEGSNINYVVHIIGGALGTTDIVIGKAFSNEKSISWYVPASLTPGVSYKILVESETGSREVGPSFNIVPPDQNIPVIRSLNTTQGRGGDSIIIYGSNFSSRVTLSTIQFLKGDKVIGYIDPSIRNPYAISIDGTQINLILDPNFAANSEAGVYQMRVANPFGDGYVYSNTVNFTLVK